MSTDPKDLNVSEKSQAQFKEMFGAEWKDVLSKDEIELIEYYCQSEMKLLGYELTAEPFNIERIESFREEEGHIREWLRKYDFGPHSKLSMIYPFPIKS